MVGGRRLRTRMRRKVPDTAEVEFVGTEQPFGEAVPVIIKVALNFDDQSGLMVCCTQLPDQMRPRQVQVDGQRCPCIVHTMVLSDESVVSAGLQGTL